MIVVLGLLHACTTYIFGVTLGRTQFSPACRDTTAQREYFPFSIQRNYKIHIMENTEYHLYSLCVVITITATLHAPCSMHHTRTHTNTHIYRSGGVIAVRGVCVYFFREKIQQRKKLCLLLTLTPRPYIAAYEIILIYSHNTILHRVLWWYVSPIKMCSYYRCICEHKCLYVFSPVVSNICVSVIHMPVRALYLPFWIGPWRDHHTHAFAPFVTCVCVCCNRAVARIQSSKPIAKHTVRTQPLALPRFWLLTTESWYRSFSFAACIEYTRMRTQTQTIHTHIALLVSESNFFSFAAFCCVI